MSSPFKHYYLRPKRVYYPPLDKSKEPTRPPKKRSWKWKSRKYYHRPRVIVNSKGALLNVLSMGCASHSESEVSDDPDTTTYKRQIYKRVKLGIDRNIIGKPAIKVSHFKNLKPKVGFKAKLGKKNNLFVEIIREIYRFTKFFPHQRYMMHDEDITPFYNVYNWTPIHKRTFGTRIDSLFLQLKQMRDNLPDTPCHPKCFKPNRDLSGNTYIGSPDSLGGQLYGRWLNDYRKNTKKDYYRRTIKPLSHKVFEFNKMWRIREDYLTPTELNFGALDIFAHPMAFNLLDTGASFVASIKDNEGDSEEDPNLYRYLSQEVPETCLVYRQPHVVPRAFCKAFVDSRFPKQHTLLPGYLSKSLKPDPFSAFEGWEQAYRRLKYQMYVSKVTNKLLYHKMLKSADDLEEEDICGDCHSSSVSSYGGDNEPKRRYTTEMAKQGAMYAYVHATSLNRKSPTRLSVLFRLLMKRYLENDNIRHKWESLQTFPCERRLSYKNEMIRLATNFHKRWYDFPPNWELYAFMKSLIILHYGVVGTQNQPICHSPPATDNEEEVNFFVKNHFPLDHKRKRLRRTMKRIPDELGRNYFKRLIELHEAFKDPNRVITRSERAEAIELYRKIDIHMLRPREILMLQKLKQLRSFFIKRRFKYFKRKQTERIEWRTLPVYGIKKHSPFTHDEIVIMCVGNGKLHYIGKLTRKEILLLTETAEEYHKNGLLSIDNDKAYALGTIMPLIKVITTLHINVKMRVLNSTKYGKTFHNKYKYLLHKSKQAMAEAALLDKNIGIKCKKCSCFKEKRLTVGNYKSDPFSFTRHLMGQLTKVERLAKASVRWGTLRRRVVKNFMFKMWEYNKLGRKFFQSIPTRDLTKLKTTPGNLYFNTLNTPYGIPHFAPISLYRVVQYAIAGQRLRDQCVHRLRRSHELLMIIRRLQKYTSLSKLKFMTGLCDEMVNKCINYMVKYKNTFRKLTKPNKSVQEKRKLRLRARRLEEKYTMLARFISKKLQGRLANHPRFRKEMLAHYGRKNKKSIYASTRRKVKSKKDVDHQNPSCDEEETSPMMLYRNSIDNLKQGPCDINSMKEAIVRRYKTLINELKEMLQLTGPKTLPKKKKSKKKKWYAVIRSMHRNAKLGKVNSHNISKSFKVWRKFNAHIQDLMDDFSDYIERLLACKMNQWPPKDEPKSLSHLFEFERPKTKPKPVEKLDECTYNKKLRVLVNNKNKKILGGYRTLKLGTDWTSKYHEIIQRKFIKVGHFHQQKDSYVIQAGKMAAKGCEKVVKKCLYALSIFGFAKKDLELALLIYAKIRIIVKMEPKALFPCKNKLIEAGEFLNTKYQIYNEAIEEHRQKMSKIKPHFISWRRRDNNFMNKVLVEQCTKPKLLIEKFFYGLDPRHVKSRKFIAKNDLFDLSDYKYYDYKSDDDFSNKLDYSSDSSRGEKINMIDCCICEGKEELRADKTTGDDYNPGRRISNALDLKKLIRSESIVSKENLITIIQDHLMSLQETQSKMEENKDFETFPDLYINTKNFHKNSKKAVLKCINLQDHDKFAYNIKVPSDNDSSSTSFDTKFRRSYFEDKEDMKAGKPHITEPDLRIQRRRKEKREKLLLRLRLGGEHYWQKTPKKLEDTFEKYLKFKLSHLKFKCQYYKKPFIPEYHPIYYLRDLPVIKEPVDTSLTFMAVANFRRELFKKVDEEHYGTDQRRGTEDIERCSIASDSEQSLTLSHTGSEKSTKKSESETLFDDEKLFVSKYDNTYQKLKGYDFLKLKEEVRNEIENFKQLLRYEKECLVQNAHSNDVLMKIAKRAEKMHPTEESLFSKSPFIHEPPSNYQKSGSIRFDPNEWQDYFSWIGNKVSYQHVHLRDIENHTQ